MTSPPAAVPQPASTNTGLLALGNVYQQGQYVAGRDINLYLENAGNFHSRAQLPNDIPEFTGRDAEIVLLGRILGGAGTPGVLAPPIVLIRDGPGVGKSALALHLAHLSASHFPDAQLHLQLGGEKLPTLPAATALEMLLRGLGVDNDSIPVDLDEKAALYRSLLADQRALVVLDNAMTEEQVQPLIPGSPSCAVLITTRYQLEGVRGVRMFNLTTLADDEALQLLERIIGQERVAREPEEAAAMVRLCGNLPLAIHLAGATLNTTARRGRRLASFVALLSDERKRLDLLKAGDRAVRASFALSFDSVSDPASRLFCLLGTLRAPHVGVQVCASLADLGVEAAQDLCDELVNAHLLEATGPDGDRYRFHDLLRLFAQECAEQRLSSEVRQGALRRAYGWYADQVRETAILLDPVRVRTLARQAEGGGPDVELDRRMLLQAGLSWFELERLNLMAVLRQANGEGEHRIVLALALDLVDFFRIRNYWRDWLITNEFALHAARAVDDRAGELRALHNLGVVQRLQRNPSAIGSLDRALELARGIGDRNRAGRILSDLGIAYREQWRFDEAIDRFERALEIFRELGDRRSESQTLNNLGACYRFQRRFDEALAHSQLAAEIVEELGDYETWPVQNLGVVYREQRRFQQSIAFGLRALAAFQELKDRHGEAWVLNNLGVTYRHQRRLDEATDHLDRAGAIFADLADRYGHAWALNNLGVVRREQGSLDQAVADAEAALSIFREIGERHGEAWVLNNLGVTYRHQRRLDEATDHHDRARAIFADLADRYGHAWALNNLGVVRREQGDPHAAVAACEQALRLLEEGDEDYSRASTLHLLAGLHRTLGEERRAQARWAAAIAALERFTEHEADELRARIEASMTSH